MQDHRTPILIGAGQVIERSDSGKLSSPLELITAAGKQAIADAGLASKGNLINTVAATGLTVDADQVKTPFKKAYSNLAFSVARELGLNPNQTAYAATGGNTPQYLVNHFANQILQGNDQTVLLVGGEALDNMFKRFQPFYKLLKPWGSWRDKVAYSYQPLGDDAPGNNSIEGKYGLTLPSTVYPMFENALAHHYGRTQSQQIEHAAKLFSQFTEVAARNAYAWFPIARAWQDLVSSSKDNRMIAHPYPKYLNSIIKVNQAAGLVLTSVAQAKAMGVDQSKWVYIAGFANQNDHWFISERENYYSSPAIRNAGERALAMANSHINEIELFDIYSCFPSAVQIACDELGISHNDTRSLTLTGGLPYFGGPGNNYSMHGIAEMVHALRERHNSKGLVNANGWYLTKHSIGVYSSSPTEVSASSYAAKQQTLDKTNVPQFVERAQGKATIEAFTVSYKANGQVDKAHIIARDSEQRRFLAFAPTDDNTIDFLTQSDHVIGAAGDVSFVRGRNRFKLN